MFKQFYKDIDTLHQLVKPFRVRYSMSKMADAWQGLADSMGSLVVSVIVAKTETKKLADALND